MFGILIDGPANVYCDNEVVYKNTSIPESTLKKKHHSIAYHRCREAIAAGTMRIAKQGTTKNLADLFTKVLAQPQSRKVMYMLTTVTLKLESASDEKHGQNEGLIHPAFLPGICSAFWRHFADLGCPFRGPQDFKGVPQSSIFDKTNITFEKVTTKSCSRKNKKIKNSWYGEVKRWEVKRRCSLDSCCNLWSLAGREIWWKMEFHKPSQVKIVFFCCLKVYFLMSFGISKNQQQVWIIW